MKNKNSSWFGVLRVPIFSAATVLAAGLLRADPGDPLGGEFAVATGAAMHAGIDVSVWGGSVAVYEADDGGLSGIFARHYFAGGIPGGDPYPVNETIANAQAEPAVAVSQYGIFMAAWVSDGQDGDGHGVYGRLFRSDGSATTGEFQVNSTTAGDQGHSSGYGPAVATNFYGGSYAVVWSGAEPGGYGVYGQLFNSFGEPAGSEFRVNTLTAPAFSTVAVAMNFGGDFVVAWEGRTLGSTTNEIIARRYDAGGAPMGSEFRVNAPAVTARGAPSASMDHAGNFVVVWQGSALDPGAGEIYAQRFDAAGTAIGGESQVNTTTLGAQGRPRVAMDADGDFVVAWDSFGQDGSDDGVYAQRFDAAGTAVGGEFLVNVLTAGVQRLGGVAIDADGDFTVVWDSAGQSSALARRYRGAPPIDLGVTLTDRADPVSPGRSLMYDVEVTNLRPYQFDSYHGIGAASGVNVVVNLPPGTFVDTTWLVGPGWASQMSIALSCTLEGALVASGTATFTIHAFAPETTGDVAADATVTADQDDPDLANNTDSELTTLGDVTPDPFAFVDLTGVPRSTDQTSNAVTVTGIDLPARVRVTDGEYSINDGPFTGAEGTVVNGDVVRVRHTSSPYWSSPTYTTLEVGDFTETFSSTTEAQDTTPDAFAFTDRLDVARSTTLTSDAIVVGGINDTASISVSGGSYSVNGGLFTSASGMVTAGASIQVRHTTSAGFSTPVNTLLTIGGVSDTFTSTTLARDIDPDAFAFTDRMDISRNTPVTSNAITVTGVNDAAPIGASAGGMYSINGGVFTSTAGTVNAGAVVRVRAYSSAEFSTAVDTILTIGGVSDTFTIVTVARDTTPDPFAFADQFDVAPGATVTSAEITVGGINDGTPVSVDGGSYSIDGGLFTTAPGSVVNGGRVRVRHTASGGFASRVSTTLTIGGVADVFTSTTVAEDTTPDAFAFADATGVATGSVVTSGSITLSGLNSVASVSVSGGSYSINGAAFTAAPGIASAGDQIRVQHVSSDSASSTVSTLLTVGGVADTFSSTTGAADTTPAPFTFTDVTGVRKGSRVTSNAITVSGINAAVTITVSGGSAQYSKNGGAYTSTPGPVMAGDTIRVRATAASTPSTTVDVVVTIGGVADVWSLTTSAK